MKYGDDGHEIADEPDNDDQRKDNHILHCPSRLLFPFVIQQEGGVISWTEREVRCEILTPSFHLSCFSQFYSFRPRLAKNMCSLSNGFSASHALEWKSNASSPYYEHILLTPVCILCIQLKYTKNKRFAYLPSKIITSVELT